MAKAKRVSDSGVLVAEKKQMRIYIAASVPRQQEGRILAEFLIEQGYTVCAEWLYSQDIGYGSAKDKSELPERAVRDLENLCTVDCIVTLSGDKLTKGGRHAEFGMGLRGGQLMILMGEREQVFHYHRDVVHIEEGNTPDGRSKLLEALKTHTPAKFGLRREVSVFAQAMEMKLRSKDHLLGPHCGDSWRHAHHDTLYRMMIEHAAKSESQATLFSYADTANFLLFLAANRLLVTKDQFNRENLELANKLTLLVKESK